MAEFAARWLVPVTIDVGPERSDEGDNSRSDPASDQSPTSGIAEPRRGGEWDQSVVETVANAQASPRQDMRDWHRDVEAAHRLPEVGCTAGVHGRADLEHDLEILRRILAPRRCLGWGKAAITGCHWCARCRSDCAGDTEVAA